jgi:dUTPase
MAKKKIAEDKLIGFSYYCRQCGFKEERLKECPKRCKICNSVYLTIGFDFKVQHYGALHLRSSLGKKFIIPNGVGVIDFDFKEEFMLLLHNPFRSGYNEHVIEKGDRVAQLIIKRHETSLIGIESDFDRNGGFGSTGK